MVVMVRRTTLFLGAAVTTGWCGPGGDDGEEDNAVPGHGSNGDAVGGGWGGSSVVPMAEEERDDTVPMCGGEVRADGTVLGHGDNVETIGLAVAWTRRRRRGRGKFWQPDGIQVKILWLGFKDRATGGFIGRQ
jgi:hypothetical protein